MQLFGAPKGPDGWVDTNRSRLRARLVALMEYPQAVALSVLRRRRGVTPANGIPVSANEILERLAAMPLSVWTYGFDHPSVRHMGPMAQDFAAAFGLGSSNREIDMLDANGVVMAACQALHQRVVDLEREVAELKALMGSGAGAADAAEPSPGSPKPL